MTFTPAPGATLPRGPVWHVSYPDPRMPTPTKYVATVERLVREHRQVEVALVSDEHAPLTEAEALRVAVALATMDTREARRDGGDHPDSWLEMRRAKDPELDGALVTATVRRGYVGPWHPVDPSADAIDVAALDVAQLRTIARVVVPVLAAHRALRAMGALDAVPPTDPAPPYDRERARAHVRYKRAWRLMMQELRELLPTPLGVATGAVPPAPLPTVFENAGSVSDWACTGCGKATPAAPAALYVTAPCRCDGEEDDG